jgi:hypothetical protein
VEVENPNMFPRVDNCLFYILEKGGEQKEFHPRHTSNFWSQYPRLRPEGWYLVCVALVEYQPGKADITFHASYPYSTLFQFRSGVAQ